MPVLTQEEKKAQFEEFFKIAHPLNVNVLPLATNTPCDFSEFEAQMPYAFKLAGQFSGIDGGLLRSLKLASQDSEALVAFLEAQSQKIDWMLSYILEQQDDPEYRHNTVNFGGGGMVIDHNAPFEVGTLAEIKLFVPSEHSAVYTHGEVITCEAKEDRYHIGFLFSHIRESDQELLVKATLHLQTQQLRARHKVNANE
ncbi:PilZ domain-containing protein [Alteromonas sp. 5E99-2]|uniref:PilZ domain-containing protein n=1 Tax=Alteromonas sp. 5E99-2 TaxID=2817683 RepID=UPI001A983DB6|nr:PilZ domain-containing protein [Alteromonas sp. 5E99-2]MBO1254921.1 PilZ domain-containing protein [Alteromonas sp. 5E99-2]